MSKKYSKITNTTVGPGSGGILNYSQRALRTQRANLLSFVLLNELSGNVATDLSGNGRHAAYGANVTRGGASFINGSPAALINGSYINWYSTSLRDAWNGDEFTFAGWTQVTDAATWVAGAAKTLLSLWTSSANNIKVYIHATILPLLASNRRVNNASMFTNLEGLMTDKWFFWAFGVSVSGAIQKTWLDGTPEITSPNPGAWSGTLGATTTCIGALNTNNDESWPGAAYGWGVWKSLLTDAEILALFHTLCASKNMLFVGDSKTDGDRWTRMLRTKLRTERVAWYGKPGMFATGGWTLADAKAYVDANLAAVTDIPDKILINLGANDVSALPAEATWKGNLTAMIDAFRSKWPAALIYIAYPWRRGELADCNTLAGWIDDICALYPSGVYAGIDERVTLEGGDDGATNTSDGIHYSDAGQIAIANAWVAVLTA